MKCVGNTLLFISIIQADYWF